LPHSFGAHFDGVRHTWHASGPTETAFVPSPTVRTVARTPIGPSREASLNLELKVAQAGGGPLANDYLAGEGNARRFFDGWWGDPDAYLAKAAEVESRFDRAARERVAAGLQPSSEAQRQRLKDWVERGGFVVTTGQQPGLFTGPLYTLYKALSAAKLAEALEELLEVPVLPLFWVASEDHDWEESNHTYVVGLGNELRKIEVQAPPGQQGRAIHRIPLEEGLPDAIRALFAELPETEFAPRLRDLIEQAYAPGTTLDAGFRTLLTALLEPFGVFLVDAASPLVKDGSRALLERELRGAEAHEALLLERALALQAEGYEPQVPILPGSVNLFVEGPAGRERLYRDADGFQLRHSGQRLSLDEVLVRLDADPLSVSPNVLLRPVVESVVLPTLSLVVGPGEAAYFGQLQPYFEALGIQPPIAFPRFSVTAIETKIGKVLEAFQMDVSDLRRPFHEIAADVARDELPEDVRSALGEIRGALGRGGAALAQAAKGVHPTLESSVKRAGSVSMEAWSDAEKKILQAVKRSNETRLAQLEKARLHVLPDGKPQERVMNAFYYLFRYGDDFLEAVAGAFEVRLRTPASRT